MSCCRAGPSAGATSRDLAPTAIRDGRHGFWSLLTGSTPDFNGTRNSFPRPVGSPDRLPPRLVPSPLAIDLQGGVGPELVFGPGDGRAFAYDAQGHPLPGWPRPGPAASGTGLVIEDLDHDGHLDMVVPSDFGAETVLIGYDLGITEGRAAPGGPPRRRIGWASHPAAGEEPQSGPLLSQLFVYPNGDRRPGQHPLPAPDASRVRVQILDALGRVVAEPLADTCAARAHGPW
jgi:hypothetical protein